jgi:hypothetical protein
METQGHSKKQKPINAIIANTYKMHIYFDHEFLTEKILPLIVKLLDNIHFVSVCLVIFYN